MTAPQIIAVLSGDLRASIERDIKAIREISSEAVQRGAKRLKDLARREVNSGFTGSGRVKGGNRRVANAIRDKVVVDPETGFARGTVYSRFGRGYGENFVDYLLPYVRGGEIRPLRGGWLYIPADGKRRSRRIRKAIGLEKGLRFVPSTQPGKVFLIKETRTRSTLVAILVRRIRIRPKIDFRRVTRQVQDEVFRQIVQGVSEL